MNDKLNALILLVALVFAAGCAQFQTKQSEVRNGETTTITTEAQAITFLAGKSALANWEAKQTEGEQGARVEALNQEADSSALVEAAVRAAIEASK